nr:retrovirus-related Pol polyprotein from transposon TNT 1-94 [Tanacetum cinerariifolium]
DNPHQTLKGKGIVDSGCSRHMTGNKAYLVHYHDFNGGPVAFGGSKGQITDTECLVLSPNFKMPDKNKVLLRVPRQHNMYSFNLENIVPSEGLACLIAKDTVDESTKWHRRCDNGTEFKNKDIIEFYGSKGIKREYSNARTPQQNRVAERKNRTLNKAARTMLADSFLPNTFWAKAVSTACYVLNRILVTKPQNKTPYELLTSKIPIISYIRPFGCHVTILNTIDHLGKFEEKSDEGFLVGCSLSVKAFRPVTAENKANKTAGPKEATNSTGTQDNLDVENSKIEADHAQEYYVRPLWSSYTSTIKSSKVKNGDEKLNEDTDSKANEKPVDQEDQDFLEELKRVARASSTNYVNTARTPVNAASTPLNTASTSTNQDDSQIPSLEDIYEVLRDGIFTSASDDDEGVVADFTNLETTMTVSNWDKIGFFRNKKDERGGVVRNKARLVSQGLRQEGGIDYDEVFAPVARIEAIEIFLAFASYMGFIIYQMDVKSALLYGKIDEEVYVSQPPGFIDSKFPNKVYKVVKAMYGLHQAPRAWYATLSTFLLQSGYRRGFIDKTLFIKKDKKDIMLDKYVAEILKKFNFLSVKTASTPIETKKPLVKDEEAVDVDVHLYRSMIGSLMYLTASRHDIIYLVCACSRFQVTPKTSHLQAMKRIFRKSITGGCQFLGRRLISWQCKKQTIVATSTTEAEYVAAASCCGQVLWIQNHMLDYGFKFVNTKIYIDNESTIYGLSIRRSIVFRRSIATVTLWLYSSNHYMEPTKFEIQEMEVKDLWLQLLVGDLCQADLIGDEFHLGFKWSFVKSRGDLLEDDIENLKRSDEFRSEDVIKMKKNDILI